MSHYLLTKEIIKRSVSDTWDKAKLEWELYFTRPRLRRVQTVGTYG
jgi:hypothetical protein